MSRLLQLGCDHDFSTRLRSLLGTDVHHVTGPFLAFGPGAILSRLRSWDRPDAALLGPYLSSARSETLSSGLFRLYPGVRVVRVGEIATEFSYGGSDVNVRAMLALRGQDMYPTETLAGPRGWIASPGREGPARSAKVTTPGPGTEPAVESELDAEAQSGAVSDVQTAPGNDPAADVESDIEAGPPSDPRPPAALVPVTVDTVAAAEGIRGQVIAVVAPKGGLGKTTVATNLAVGLAGLAPLSVVLIDADMQFGDVATALSLEPTYTLPDVVNGAPAEDTMALKTYLTPHQGGFYVVCGSDVPADGDRVTGEQLTELILRLSQVFRFVIIDTAPGLGEHALSAIELATDAVFLCDMSVPSARGLRKELSVLTSIGLLPPVRHVVLNLANRKGGLSVRDIEAIIGVPVDVAIPRSNLVALSTNRGIPLLQEGTRSPASKALHSLVHRFEPTALMKRGHLHRRVEIA